MRPLTMQCIALTYLPHSAVAPMSVPSGALDMLSRELERSHGKTWSRCGESGGKNDLGG